MSPTIPTDEAPTGVNHPVGSRFLILPWVLLGGALLSSGALAFWLRSVQREFANERVRTATALRNTDATAERLRQFEAANQKLFSQWETAQAERQALLDNVKALSQELDTLDRDSAQLKKTYEFLQAALKADIRARKLVVLLGKGRVQVALLEELFDETDLGLTAGGKALLERLGEALRKTDALQAISVSSHTDDAPLPSHLAARFPSVWELSAMRAAVAARYLVENASVPGERVSAAGYGKFTPVTSDATLDGAVRHRRVDVLLAPAHLLEKARPAPPPRPKDKKKKR